MWPGGSVLLCAQVERHGGQLVDQRVGQSVLAWVDAFDVGLAGVAALDADVGQFGGGVHGKLGMVLLGASGTDEAAELPFGEAEAAEQAATASVALRAEDGERRLAMAKRAELRRVAR